MKMICAWFVLARKFFFCSHRGNLNRRESNRVCFGNCLQMALIEHAYRLNNFEKEKGMRLDACDRPFPSSNELQRAPHPNKIAVSKLRHPGRAGSGRALATEHGLSHQPLDWHRSRQPGRAFIDLARRKCCLLMRTPATASSSPTQRFKRGPSPVPRFRPQDRTEPAICRIKMADRRLNIGLRG
jgi:hypothetical protein